MATRVPRLAVGVLAGGQGMRAGGVDKGWIERGGVAQIERVLAAVERNVRLVRRERPAVAIDGVVVSANRSLSRYEALGVDVVPDRWPDFPGPMAGIASLAALLQASASWLLTLPVDVDTMPDDYLANMLHAADGSVSDPAPIVAADLERDQPLFALYAPLHLDAITQSFAGGERSIARWQRDRHAHICRFPALRFGNLNTPHDLPSA